MKFPPGETPDYVHENNRDAAMTLLKFKCDIDACDTWYESDDSPFSAELMRRMVEKHLSDKHSLKECPTCEGSGDCGFVDDATMTIGGPQHFTRNVHFVTIHKDPKKPWLRTNVCACCKGTTYVELDSNHSDSDDCGNEPPEEDYPEPEEPEENDMTGTCSCHDMQVCPDG